MAKGDLSNSKRINACLSKMGISTFDEILEHLPRRYDDFSLTHERNLEDKERVTIYAKVITTPKKVLARKTTVITFDVLTSNNTYFKVVAFNRPYLSKLVDLNEDYTINGVYDKSKNHINLVNIHKGKIEDNKTLKPVYMLPSDLSNADYIRLVAKALRVAQGYIPTLVPYSFRNKYRLCTKDVAYKYAHTPNNYDEIHQAYRYLNTKKL